MMAKIPLWMLNRSMTGVYFSEVLVSKMSMKAFIYKKKLTSGIKLKGRGRKVLR